MSAQTGFAPRFAHLPLLSVLHPRRQSAFLAVVLAGVLSVSWYLSEFWDWKLWQVTALVFAVMLLPLGVKWRADAKRFGGAIALAGAFVIIQGVHAIEHGTQWVQRHILDRPLRQSNGLLSPANSEWVHFGWNWIVLVMIIVLMVKGMRGPWAWVLLIWSTAHTLEHTYMWIRFLQVSGDLRSLGFPKVTAQGLPGVFGRDGWLDRNRDGSLGFVCRIPLAATATRLDTHAMWNTGEVAFMALAANAWLRRYFSAFAGAGADCGGQRATVAGAIEDTGVVAVDPSAPSVRDRAGAVVGVASTGVASPSSFPEAGFGKVPVTDVAPK